jgi:hypothetical protein
MSSAVYECGARKMAINTSSIVSNLLSNIFPKWTVCVFEETSLVFPRKKLSTSLIEPFPLARMIEIAPLPTAVAIAVIISLLELNIWNNNLLKITAVSNCVQHEKQNLFQENKRGLRNEKLFKTAELRNYLFSLGMF